MGKELLPSTKPSKGIFQVNSARPVYLNYLSPTFEAGSVERVLRSSVRNLVFTEFIFILGLSNITYCVY